MRDDPLAAIEAVYREQYASFVRLALAVTRNEQQALDAVHDGFVRAVRYRDRLRNAESAAAWIFRIVLNEARKRAATDIVVPSPAHEPPGENGHSERGGLVAAVASLPEQQRLVLFLRYYADLEYRDIAEALGIARGTVAATLNAAHASLKQTLAEEERWTI